MRAVSPAQLSIRLDHHEALIEVRAAQALAEIRAMAADALAFINRSCGQHCRRLRERNEDIRDALIARERLRELVISNPIVEKQCSQQRNA